MHTLTLTPFHTHPHMHSHTLPLTSSPHTYSLICVRSRLNSEISHGKRASSSPTPSPSPPHTASHQHVQCLTGVTPFHLTSLGHTPFLSTGNFGNTLWYCELFTRFSNYPVSLPLCFCLLVKRSIFPTLLPILLSSLSPLAPPLLLPPPLPSQGGSVILYLSTLGV